MISQREKKREGEAERRMQRGCREEEEEGKISIDGLRGMARKIISMCLHCPPV